MTSASGVSLKPGDAEVHVVNWVGHLPVVCNRVRTDTLWRNGHPVLELKVSENCEYIT